MNIFSIFNLTVVYFGAYSQFLFIPIILGLMAAVFLFRKNENYAFIILVLFLSLLGFWYIPSFVLVQGPFSYLSDKFGSLISFVFFILANLAAILLYLFYKKIFSNNILGKLTN